MSHLRRAVVAIVCVLAAVACRPSSPSAQADGSAGKQSSPSAGSWYEIARTPEIVAYLDTARIERLPNGVARIWFRFRYAEPMQLGTDATERYVATEAREELDCPGRRTKDLELRVESTKGVTVGAPLPKADFQPIDGHTLNSGVFLVACRALGTSIANKPGG